MSMLGNLTTDSNIEEEQDRLGGGGGYQPLESNVYAMTIKLAYVTKAPTEAMALNLLLETEEGKTLKSRQYMTSGKAKGCKNFYERKDKSTGKVTKHYLPGFNQANAISLLTVGKEISELATEKKTINLYDAGERKEVPTEVDMVMELLEEKVYAAVLKQRENKRAKSEATGMYEPTEEIKEVNEIDKIFRIEDKLTVQEIKQEADEATFMPMWLEKWEGKTKDKTVKTGVTSGAPSQTATKPKKSLFGK